MNQTKPITSTPPRYVYPEIEVDEVTVENGFAASTEDLYEDGNDIPW